MRKASGKRQTIELVGRNAREKSAKAGRLILITRVVFALKVRVRLRPRFVGPTVYARGLAGLQSWARQPTCVGRRREAGFSSFWKVVFCIICG